MDYIIPVASIILGAFLYYLTGCASYKTKSFGMLWLFAKTAAFIDEKLDKEIPSSFFFIAFDTMVESIKDDFRKHKAIEAKAIFLFLWPGAILILLAVYIFLLALYFVYVALFLACRIVFRIFIKAPYDWATNQGSKTIG
jgi:hypothetical protein